MLVVEYCFDSLKKTAINRASINLSDKSKYFSIFLSNEQPIDNYFEHFINLILVRTFFHAKCSTEEDDNVTACRRMPERIRCRSASAKGKFCEVDVLDNGLRRGMLFKKVEYFCTKPTIEGYKANLRGMKKVGATQNNAILR